MKWVAVAVVGVLLCGGAIVWAEIGPIPELGGGSGQTAVPNSVYFTHSGSPSSQLTLLPAGTLTNAGGRVVSSEAQLEASNADAVILDGSTIAEVPANWLNQRYLGGTILVALNFPGEQLKAKVPASQGLFGPLPDSDNQSGGRLAGVPYASMLWHSPQFYYPNGGYRAGQYHIDLDPARPDVLLKRIARTFSEENELPETPYQVTPTATPQQSVPTGTPIG